MGKTGPKVQLTKCYNEPNDFFRFDADGVWSGGSGVQPYPRRCLQVEHGYEIEAQLWAKPQDNGAMAVFAFNAGSRPSVSFQVDIAKLFSFFGLSGSSAAEYNMRDVWN